MNRWYKPLLERYLAADRNLNYGGFGMKIPSGVFHPAFFGSSKVFARFLEHQDLSGKTLLEVGCGSGLLSMTAARRRALVTAIDINPKAVDCARLNALENGLDMKVLQSDLFEQLPRQKFDVILCNPPYFPAQPADDAAFAWYCGKDFDFFHRFFAGIPDYVHPESRVWLILSEVCQMAQISAISKAYGFSLKKIRREQRLFEIFTIFGAERE